MPLKCLSALITQTKEKLQRFPSIRSRKPTARMGINAYLLNFFSPAVPVVDCPHPAEEDAAHLEMQELRLEPRIPLCLHFFLHLPLTPLLPVTVYVQAGKQFPDMRQNERRREFMRAGDAVRTEGRFKGKPVLSW